MRTRLPFSPIDRQRSSDGNRTAKDLLKWNRQLRQHWPKLRFGSLRVETEGEQHLFHVPVYLDELEEVPGGERAAVTDAEEAAWRTAVDAAPWLVGEPDGAVNPDELYEKLKPFEQRVADDIASSRGSDDGGS